MVRLARLGSCLAGIALVCGATAGCAAIFPGNREPVPCAIVAGEPDPCLEARQRCVEDLCRSVCLDAEVCNGIDDDCDDAVDDGIDADRDGFFGCMPSGTANADCNDASGAVRPDATETCNGADDDSDLRIDEAPVGTRLCGEGLTCIARLGGCVQPRCEYPESPLCSDGFVCNPMAGACEPGDDCTTSGCPGEWVCDTRTRRCRPPPAPLGAGCFADAECLSGLCYPARESLRLVSGVDGTTGLCSTACCTDADCPTDSVCWTPGTGARGCVPRTLLEAEGAGAPDLMTCAHAEACTQACVAVDVDAYDRTDLFMMACGVAPRDGDRDPCRRYDDCRSGLCIPYYEDSFSDYVGPCSGACRSTADCQAYGALSFPYPSVSMHCGYVHFQGAIDWLQVCVPDDEGRGPHGAPCASSPECLDDACIDGRCAMTCCSDRQCARGEICRPSSINGRWEMHCVPTSP
jgi:hypothetical protein